MAQSAPSTEQQLVRVVLQGDSHHDLVEMMLLLSVLEQPSTDLVSLRQQLGELGELADARLTPEGSASGRASALCAFISEEQQFGGDSDDYYNPRNSNLQQLLTRRRGIPISLAFLYLHCAERRGWTAQGLAFPGHFLVAVYPEGTEAAATQSAVQAQPSREFSIIDPFHGRILSVTDCESLLHQQFGQNAALRPEYFQPAANSAIMRRVLCNLKHGALREQRHSDALRWVNILLDTAPGDIAELHDRAAILEHMHCYAAAAADLQQISQQYPGHPRLTEIQQTIVRLQGFSTPTMH